MKRWEKWRGFSESDDSESQPILPEFRAVSKESFSQLPRIFKNLWESWKIPRQWKDSRESFKLTQFPRNPSRILRKSLRIPTDFKNPRKSQPIPRKSWKNLSRILQESLKIPRNPNQFQENSGRIFQESFKNLWQSQAIPTNFKKILEESFKSPSRILQESLTIPGNPNQSQENLPESFKNPSKITDNANQFSIDCWKNPPRIPTTIHLTGT